MDCVTFLFFGIIVVVGISQLIEKKKTNRFQQQIMEAYRNGDYAEILRLTNERDRRAGGANQAGRNSPGNLDYLEAMIVLDAAEHGIFTPNGNIVFDRMNGQDGDSTAENEPDYFDQYYDEIDQGEYSDHWGLG